MAALVFSISFVAAGLAASPQFARAYEYRLPPSLCRSSTEAGNDFTDSGGLYNSRPDSVNDAFYYCPLPSNTDFNHLSTARVHVHGADNHSTREVQAAACVTFFDAPGGACGPMDASNFTGNYQIELTGTGVGQELDTLTDGAQWGDFPHVFIRVPGIPSGGIRSSVRGIFVTTVP